MLRKEIRKNKKMYIITSLIILIGIIYVCLPQTLGRAAEKQVQKVEAVPVEENMEIGSQIDTEDVIVTVIYEDETREQLTSAQFVIISNDIIAEGENEIAIKYTYNGNNYICRCNIKGVTKEVEYIEASLKTQKSYGIGKEIGNNDIIVTAYYNTGDSESVEAQCGIENNEITEIGTNEVKIVYTYEQKKVETILKVQGEAVSVVSIEARYEGDRYIPVNGSIDSSKIVVTGYFNNDKSEIISGYYILPYKLKVNEVTVITVKYKECETCFLVYGIEDQSTPASTSPSATPDIIPPSQIPVSESPSATPSATPDIAPPSQIPVSDSPSATPDIAPPSQIPASNPPSDAPVSATPSATPTIVPSSQEPVTEEPIPTTPIKTVEPPETIDYALSSNLKGLKLTTEKEDYKLFTNKNIICYFKVNNIQKVQYQLVQKGKKLTNKWKSVSKNKLELKNQGKYIMYLRFWAGDDYKIIEKTKGFVIDKTAPTIKGVANKKTYKTGVTIKCSDSLSGIKKVTLNGSKISNNYSISKNGSYKVVARDKANNKKTISFKIAKPISTPKPTPKSTPKPTLKPTQTPTPSVPKTIKVSGITISKTSITLKKNNSTKLSVSIIPANATNKAVVWSSTQPGVATVSSNGTVTAKKKGTAVIYVVSKSNPKVTARCTVYVK